MERFDEPKPELKAHEEEITSRKDVGDSTLLTAGASPKDDLGVSKLVTEPAQLARTRAQLPPPAAAQIADEGANKDDAVADFLGLLKPLIVVVLLLGVPWICGPFVFDNWIGAERSRAYMKAEAAEKNDQLDEAATWIKRGMAVLPPVENKDLDEHTKSRYAWSYARLGQLAMAKGNVYMGQIPALTQALKNFEMATKLAPDEVWIAPNYADALTRDGRPDLAVKVLEAVSKSPKDAFGDDYLYYQRQLALAYNFVGRYNDALDAALRASVSDDVWDRIRADILAGDALEGLGRHQEALQKYKSAANSGIDHNLKSAADYLRGGGIYYMDAPRQQGLALAWLNGALQKAREHPAFTRYDQAAILNDLAKLDLMQNHPHLAIEKLQKAIELDRKKSTPDNLDYARDLYNLASAQSAAGDKAGAISSLTKCLAIRQNLLSAANPLTRHALQQLQQLMPH